MSIRVEAAREEHFHLLHERFFKPLNPLIPVATWHRLFNHEWAGEGQPRGHVLFSGQAAVGFAGTVHARLPLPDGTSEPTCNITTWVVEPDHRSRGLSLIMPILSASDVTITNLTGLSTVHEMFVRLGFRDLETAVCVLRPTPLSRSPWGKPEVVEDLDSILPLLPSWERRIAQDHRPYARHLLLRERGGEHCYVIYTLGLRRRLRTARLQWVTPEALGGASVALRRALFRATGAVLSEIDDRFAPLGLPGAMRTPLVVPRLFRSPRLEANQVPSAYSEMVLLELP
jgi:hypothetical protein